MKKVKIRLLMILYQSIPFFILFIVTKLFMNDFYLFEYMARHLYFYVWIIIFLLIYKNKFIIASSLNIGNILSLVIGQFLGDYIKHTNSQKITSTTLPELKYRLQLHHGVEIWLLGMVASLIVGIYLYKRSKNERIK